MHTKLARAAKAALVGGSALALTAVATPAHAALYATGVYSYVSQGTDSCFETYVGTGAGTTGCSVSLSIGTFAIVVNHRDGTCSGVAPATMTITSPSTPNAPPAVGLIEISHGVGSFDGDGTDGLVISFAKATVTGSRCAPTIINDTRSLNGKYELHA